MKNTCFYQMLIAIILLFSSTYVYSLETDSLSLKGQDAPNLFIDCRDCDMDHIKRNITFVNYVRDREQADVYLLVTERRTGSRGLEYTLTFDGKGRFQDLKDTLLFSVLSYETEENIREGFISTLKLGLIPYVSKTSIAHDIKITYKNNGKTEEKSDGWDFWVFRTQLRGGLRGEKSRDSYDLGGSFRADRITEDWKIRLRASFDYEEDNYNFEDEEPYSSIGKDQDINIEVVKSLSDHWSVGLYSKAEKNTYRNQDYSLSIKPAIEYNIFPYSESTYHEYRIFYYIGLDKKAYMEETIYAETKELLGRQTLGFSLEIKQPWGSIDTRLQASSYLHDISKNSLQLSGYFSFNLFEGFNFDFGGYYSMIHDQLSLPKRDLDLTEILLHRRELETQYYFRTYFGFSYTFGAIYNNIVNSRFGN